MCDAQRRSTKWLPLGRSMLFMYAGAPWLHVHAVPFTANSTSSSSYVNFDELSLALRSVGQIMYQRTEDPIPV